MFTRFRGEVSAAVAFGMRSQVCYMIPGVKGAVEGAALMNSCLVKERSRNIANPIYIFISARLAGRRSKKAIDTLGSSSCGYLKMFI